MGDDLGLSFIFAIPCPYAAINHKAKVLASLLDRHLNDRPSVHAAVFTNNVTEVKLEGGSWAAMTSAGNSLWQATVTAPAKTGNRILEVKATSPEGSDTHKIKFLVGT